jgi:hypothetical protein
VQAAVQVQAPAVARVVPEPVVPEQEPVEQEPVEQAALAAQAAVPANPTFKTLDPTAAGTGAVGAIPLSAKEDQQR